MFQPIAGAAADKFGAGRAVAIGGFVYVVALFAASLSQGPIGWFLSAGILIGLAQSSTAFAVVLGAVARAVPDNRRSVALGIASTAASAGMFCLVPFAQWLVSELTWRGALQVMAALLIAVPILAFGLRRTTVASVAPSIPAWRALQIAGRDRSFWLLNLGFAACGLQLAFLATHFPTIVFDAGLPIIWGAEALATIGLFNIFGTYASGLLGASFRKKYLLCFIYAVRAAAILAFLALPMSHASILIFAAVMGLLWTGTVPLTNGLLADIYSHRNIGLLFGTVYLSHQIGAFFGAWLGGASFERYGSYSPIWIGTIAIGLIAVVLHWPIMDSRREGWDLPDGSSR